MSLLGNSGPLLSKTAKTLSRSRFTSATSESFRSSSSVTNPKLHLLLKNLLSHFDMLAASATWIKTQNLQTPQNQVSQAISKDTRPPKSLWNLENRALRSVGESSRGLRGRNRFRETTLRSKYLSRPALKSRWGLKGNRGLQTLQGLLWN